MTPGLLQSGRWDAGVVKVRFLWNGAFRKKLKELV